MGQAPISKNKTSLIMKKIALFTSFVVFIFSCGAKEDLKNLEAAAFQKAINTETNKQILDVRSVDEFQNGHIEGAVNADINSPSFQQIATRLEKTKTVFVYCLSGARSASAAGQLKEMGFSKIVNLTGGMLAWQSANLPVATNQLSNSSNGLTETSFAAKIKGKPLVIIDYNATWCGPCKQLSPILKAWVKAQKGAVELIEIDVDENQELAKSKKIEAIPYLEMYKNGVKTWSNVGLIGKEGLDKSLGK
jgi:thioredoxin